jgi:hypothetical protein
MCRKVCGRDSYIFISSFLCSFSKRLCWEWLCIHWNTQLPFFNMITEARQAFQNPFFMEIVIIAALSHNFFKVIVKFCDLLYVAGLSLTCETHLYMCTSITYKRLNKITIALRELYLLINITVGSPCYVSA